MAKPNKKNQERKARVEQMLREQKRKERRQGMIILSVAVVLVVGLLSAAIVPYVKKKREQDRVDNLDLASIGASRTAADCSPQKTRTAEGSGQHIAPPQTITYKDAPPAFGKHWGNFLTPSELRTFYSRTDTPQIERLVHSLEHGHTILWYDDTIKAGTPEYEQIQQIGQKLGLDSYFIAAPYISSKYGGTFPKGKHVALTHWTGPKNQKGVWEYCAKTSGKVVQDFVSKYPKTDAPEPGAS